jgi:hypothetical protein
MVTRHKRQQALIFVVSSVAKLPETLTAMAPPPLAPRSSFPETREIVPAAKRVMIRSRYFMVFVCFGKCDVGNL